MKKSSKIATKHKKASKLLRWILGIAICFCVIGVIAWMMLAIYIDRYVEKHIDESMFTMVGADSAKFYRYEENEDGERVAIEVSEEKLYGGYRCIYAEYDSIPSDLIHAFISIEDKRFFSHQGVDWKRTFLAGVNYFFKFH